MATCNDPAPEARGRAGKTTPRSNGSTSVHGSAVVPRYTGCPCGCMTKPPYLDDEDCVRHLPTPAQIEYDGHDVVDLGLAVHDRHRCEPCQAVGR